MQQTCFPKGGGHIGDLVSSDDGYISLRPRSLIGFSSVDCNRLGSFSSFWPVAPGAEQYDPASSRERSLLMPCPPPPHPLASLRSESGPVEAEKSFNAMARFRSSGLDQSSSATVLGSVVVETS